MDRRLCLFFHSIHRLCITDLCTYSSVRFASVCVSICRRLFVTLAVLINVMAAPGIFIWGAVAPGGLGPPVRSRGEALGRVANSRPVAKIKTGRVSQPITDADVATGLGMQRAPGMESGGRN